MGIELSFIIKALAVLIIIFVIINRVLTYRARHLRYFLNEVANKCEIDPHFENHLCTTIYYDRAHVLGMVNVDKRGVFLYSLNRFNVLLPWEKIISIRFVELKGDKIANFRISSHQGVNRKLSFEWDSVFNEKIPGSVSQV